MSNNTPPETQGPPPKRDDMHPMAKVLFGWLDIKGIQHVIFYGLLLASVLVLAADFLVERHDYFEAGTIKGAYGVYGFVAFSFAVLSGWPLGRLLRRDENYYGDADDPEEREWEED